MPAANDILLSCDQLTVSVPGRQLVESLDLTLRRGEFLAVLGQNGAGKSLSMLTMAGLRTPANGRVCLGGRDISSMKRSEIAAKLALLTQAVDDIFPASVLDTALIGRHPHIGSLQWESRKDRDIALNALRAMDIDALAERDVLTLSGGERRRLAVAQVLAQAPDVYLLDEPTNHLDPQHQLDVLRVFRAAVDKGAGVVASLHDVNLASRFADRCLLLYGDGRWDLGTTEQTLTEDRLEALYGTAMESVSWRSQRLFVATGRAPAG